MIVSFSFGLFRAEGLNNADAREDIVENGVCLSAKVPLLAVPCPQKSPHQSVGKNNEGHWQDDKKRKLPVIGKEENANAEKHKHLLDEGADIVGNEPLNGACILGNTVHKLSGGAL